MWECRKLARQQSRIPYITTRSRQKREQGIYYPDTTLHWFQQVPVIKTTISDRFSHAHFNKAITTVDLNQWTFAVISHCIENRCDKVIVSSEFCWAAPAMQSPFEYHDLNKRNLEYLAQSIRSFKEEFFRFSNKELN